METFFVNAYSTLKRLETGLREGVVFQSVSTM